MNGQFETQLLESLRILATEVHHVHKAITESHSSLATKDDLSQATEKIIKAIRASNPSQDAAIAKATEDLKAATEPLAAAVKANQ